MARGDGFSVIKRTRNGRELANYEVRTYVPPEWREILGDKHALKSTGTGDRRAANRAAPGIVSEQYRKWELLVRRQLPAQSYPLLTPTDAELEQIAVALGYEDPAAAADIGRRALRDKGRLIYDGHVNLTREELEDQIRASATSDYTLVKDLAERAIQELGLDLPVESEGYIRLCDLLNEARLAHLREQYARITGAPVESLVNPLVERVRAKDACTAEPGETLLELFDEWAEEALAKATKREDTVRQDRKVISRFAEFVGPDRAIKSIHAQDVFDYRETLRKLPPKWMSKRELRGLDMRSAARRARELDLPRMSFTNINKHLSTISPLYKWLAARPKWVGLRNPCEGLYYADVKGKNRRPTFSTDTLNKMINSPLFLGFEADGKEHVPGTRQAADWRFWLPLLAMFTGARLGELAQLRIRDVRKESGFWFIHIRHDQRSGLSTKAGQSRPAGVHHKLEELGFIAFHERQSAAAGGDVDAQLFPELTPNARGQISGTPSVWWRKYLAKIGVKDLGAQGGDGQGSHSFRHTLADRLRVEAELLDEQVGVCLGHSIKSTTAGYGSLPHGTAKMLKGWIDTVRFDGVDFSKLLTKAVDV